VARDTPPRTLTSVITGKMGDVVYHVSFGLPFGYVSSVSSWCRVPALMAMVARRMFACLCDSYIDDWCIVDFADAGSSSQDALHALHSNFKMPLAACCQPYCPHCQKHPLPPTAQERVNPAKCKRHRHASFADFLGVVIDFFFSFITSDGCVIITPKTDRCARILSELNDCAQALQLHPSLAKKIFGKVSFLCTSLFGGVGRAPARPPIQRANLGSHENSFAIPAGGLLPPRLHAWTDDLEDMRSFYKTVAQAWTRESTASGLLCGM